jgi:hypothetical protein
MRARTIGAGCLALAGGVVLAAQARLPPSGPPTQPATASKRNYAPAKNEKTVVEGCLHGSTLEPTSEDLILDTYNATAYDLDVSKSMRELLKAHDGHFERVTGTLTIPRDDDRVATTKQVGSKTQVAIASGSSTPSADGRVSITVSAMQHISDKCAVLGKRDPNPDRTGTATIK